MENWELERLFEQIKDAFGSLISTRSAWISEQLDKPNPNTAQITRWENEQGEYIYQRDNIFSLEKPKLETLLVNLLTLIEADLKPS